MQNKTMNGKEEEEEKAEKRRHSPGMREDISFLDFADFDKAVDFGVLSPLPSSSSSLFFSPSKADGKDACVEKGEEKDLHRKTEKEEREDLEWLQNEEQEERTSSSSFSSQRKEEEERRRRRRQSTCREKLQQHRREVNLPHLSFSFHDSDATERKEKEKEREGESKDFSQSLLYSSSSSSMRKALQPLRKRSLSPSPFPPTSSSAASATLAGSSHEKERSQNFSLSTEEERKRFSQKEQEEEKEEDKSRKISDEILDDMKHTEESLRSWGTVSSLSSIKDTQETEKEEVKLKRKNMTKTSPPPRESNYKDSSSSFSSSSSSSPFLSSTGRGQGENSSDVSSSSSSFFSSPDFPREREFNSVIEKSTISHLHRTTGHLHSGRVRKESYEVPSSSLSPLVLPSSTALSQGEKGERRSAAFSPDSFLQELKTDQDERKEEEEEREKRDYEGRRDNAEQEEEEKRRRRKSTLSREHRSSYHLRSSLTSSFSSSSFSPYKPVAIIRPSLSPSRSSSSSSFQRTSLPSSSSSSESSRLSRQKQPQKGEEENGRGEEEKKNPRPFSPSHMPAGTEAGKSPSSGPTISSSSSPFLSSTSPSSPIEDVSSRRECETNHLGMRDEGREEEERRRRKQAQLDREGYEEASRGGEREKERYRYKEEEEEERDRERRREEVEENREREVRKEDSILAEEEEEQGRTRRARGGRGGQEEEEEEEEEKEREERERLVERLKSLDHLLKSSKSRLVMRRSGIVWKHTISSLYYSYHQWLQRWLVLDGSILKCYLDSNSVKPKTSVSLQHALVEGLFSPEENFELTGVEMWSFTIRWQSSSSSSSSSSLHSSLGEFFLPTAVSSVFSAGIESGELRLGEEKGGSPSIGSIRAQGSESTMVSSTPYPSSYQPPYTSASSSKLGMTGGERGVGTGAPVVGAGEKEEKEWTLLHLGLPNRKEALDWLEAIQAAIAACSESPQVLELPKLTLPPPKMFLPLSRLINGVEDSHYLTTTDSPSSSVSQFSRHPDQRNLYQRGEEEGEGPHNALPFNTCKSLSSSSSCPTIRREGEIERRRRRSLYLPRCLKSRVSRIRREVLAHSSLPPSHLSGRDVWRLVSCTSSRRVFMHAENSLLWSSHCLVSAPIEVVLQLLSDPRFLTSSSSSLSSQVKQFSSHSSEDVFGSSSPSSLFFSSPLQALSSSSRQRSWSFSLLGIFESFRRRREGRSRRRKTRKQGRDPEDEGNSRQGAPSSSFPPLPPSSSFASPSVDKDKFRDSTRRGSASAYIRRRDDVNRENEEKVEEDEEDEYEGDMIEISFPLLPVSSSSGMSPETAGCLPEESEEEEELLEEKEKKGKEDGRSHQQKGETRKKRQKFLPSQAVTAERVSLLLRPVLLFFSLLYLFILPYTFLSFFSILLFFLFALLRLLPLCRNVSVKLLRSGWTEFSPETGPLSSVFVVACTPPPPSSSSLSSSSNPSQDVERERKKKRRPWHFEAKEEEEELPFLSRVKGLIEKGCLLFSSLSSCFSSLTSKVAPSLISNTNSNSSLSSSSSSSLSSSSSSSVSSSSVLWKRVERMVRVFLQIDFSSLFRFFFLKLERFLETLSLAFSGRSIEIELEYAVWKLSRNVEDPQGSTSLSCFLKFAPRQSNPLAAMCIQEEKETKTGKNRKKIDRFSSSSSLSAFRYLFPYLFTERKYGRRSLSPIEKKIKEEEEKEEETGAAAFSFSAVHTPENVTPLHLALHLLFGSRRKRNREILAFSAAGIFNHLDAIFDIALLSLQQEPDDLPSSTQIAQEDNGASSFSSSSSTSLSSSSLVSSSSSSSKSRGFSSFSVPFLKEERNMFLNQDWEDDAGLAALTNIEQHRRIEAIMYAGPDELSVHQREALHVLLQRYTPYGVFHRDVLFFLYLTNWKMYTAEAFLLQLLTWRSHGFINRLEARHVVHQELSNCWGCVYGLDRLSRPCLVIKLKNLKISFSSSSSSLDWVLALIYLVEEALKNMDRDVEQLTALIDAKDFSLSQIHIQELFMIKSLLQTYYPERLGLVLVISPNLQAKLLWRTLQSHLPESTRSKVFFVPETSPEKSRKFFLTFFEESRLPRWCIQRYFSPSPSSSSLVS